MPEIILLLTATVRPQNLPNLAITNASSRMAQYKESVKFWATQRGIDRIIFGDNSGHDLSEIAEVAGKSGAKGRFELLSFEAPPFNPRHGKGYGELLIVERAAQSLAEHSIVIKVTGRLIVANFSELLPRFQRPRAVTVDLLQGLRRADTRLFSATPQFLRDRLLPLRDQLDEDEKIWLEHLLARATLREISEGGVWAPLTEWPDYRGISGSSGKLLTQPILRRWLLRARHRAKNACYGELA